MPLDRTRPFLNDDVLLNIMRFSDALTICRLMQISRPLYHQGPGLLIPRDLTLFHEAELESFIAFMSAEGPYRFKFLHTIIFMGDAISKRVAQLLVDFFVRFAPVLKLEVCGIGQAEAFFGSHPALADAFAKLSGIQKLELSEMGPLSVAMLRSSQLKLKSVALLIKAPSSGLPIGEADDEIEHDEEEREDEDEAEEGDDEDSDEEDSVHDEDDDDSSTPAPDARNFILLMSQSKHTLRSISASWSLTGPPKALYDIQYPLVTELCLENNEIPITRRYVRAFPNLRSLSLSASPQHLSTFSENPVSFLLPYESNEAQQRKYGTWNALMVVRGALWDVFLLALQCPVRRLIICGPWLDALFLSPILRPTRAPYMHLESFDVTRFDNGQFGEAMSDPSAACLRSLDISLTLGRIVRPEEIDIVHTLDMLVAGLADVSIHTLGLSICCSALQVPLFHATEVRYCDLRALFGPGTPCATELHLATLDLDALARRIQAAAPSIRTVVVTLAGLRGRENVTVVVGAEHALALGEAAVEVIPLKVGEALRKSWGKGARFLKEMREGGGAEVRAVSGAEVDKLNARLYS
ncbi:hypothetical protein VTO73DRAFT_11421 [Trametes versicolor]